MLTRDRAKSQLEGWELHWLSIKRNLDLRAAAITFLCVVVVTAIGLGYGERQVERFYYAMNIAVNHRDVRYDNMRDDRLLQAYLRAKPAPGYSECVLLGSSLTATAHDQDPRQRLQGWLEAKLDQKTGEKWRCTNLAADGAVTWTYFYNARLLRLYRPPKVLVLGLDLNSPRDRNLRLLLDVGVRDSDLTPAELSYVAPYNRQLLYVTEANAQRWLRDNTAIYRSLSYATLCFPKYKSALRWFRFLSSYLIGSLRDTPELSGSNIIRDTPKSWRESPSNKARIEYYRASGGVPQPWDDRMPAEYELLFTELQHCQEAGIQVVVVSMPRNPAVQHLLGPMQNCVMQAAAKHHVAFHDFWLSQIIPDQYYLDSAHFFGRGSEIMGNEIAQLIVAQQASPRAGGNP